MRNAWLKHPLTVRLLTDIERRIETCRKRAMTVRTMEDLVRTQSEYATLHGIMKTVESLGKEDSDA